MNSLTQKKLTSPGSSVLVVVLFLLVCNSLQSQTRPPQDIRRITVTNQYVIENGKKTAKFWAIYQEMFDSLGRLHTEIEWNFITHQPTRYQWHTYNGKQIMKTYFFVNNNLKTIKEYYYTKDSLISYEVITKVSPGDTSKYLTLNYHYNKNNKTEQVEAKNANGKVAYISKYTYDEKGNLLTLKVKVKKDILPQDSIVELNNTLQYDSIGRLKIKRTKTLKQGKRFVIEDIYYKYNNKNQIIELSTKDTKGELVAREEKFYDANRNRLQQIKYYNSANKLIKWLAFRYELYRSKDLTFREIDY